MTGILEFLEKKIGKPAPKPAADQPQRTAIPIPPTSAAPAKTLDFDPLIAVTGDWHLFRRQYNIAQRITDVYVACDQIADAVVHHKIPLLVHTGDVFHRNVMRPIALQQAITLFTKIKNAGTRTICIRGNHDGSTIAARNEDTMLNNLTEVGLITYVEAGIENYNAGSHVFRLYCISHCGRNLATQLEALIAREDEFPIPAEWEGIPVVRVLVIHAIVEGMDVIDYAVDVSQDVVRPYGFDLILTGHYHGKWHDTTLNIFNPGSPETMDIKSGGVDRGFWILGFKDGRLQAYFSPITTRPFHDVAMDVGETELDAAITRATQYAEEIDADDGVFRLTVSGALTDARAWEFPTDAIKKLFTKAFHVVGVVNELRDQFIPPTPDDEPQPAVDEREAFRMVFQIHYPNADDLERVVDLCISARDELVSRKVGRHDSVRENIVKLVQRSSAE